MLAGHPWCAITLIQKAAAWLGFLNLPKFSLTNGFLLLHERDLEHCKEKNKQTGPSRSDQKAAIKHSSAPHSLQAASQVWPLRYKEDTHEDTFQAPK